MKNNGINKLYHYTDESNIRSIIKKGGLYSWKTCDKLDIQIPKSGGNQATRKIDETNNLGNFIKLSFNKGNQMQYIATEDGRIDNLVILEIDPRVCFWFKISKDKDLVYREVYPRFWPARLTKDL